MKIDIITIFPKMVEGPLAEGIVARAIAKGLIDVRVHDLREFTTDRHRVVDDMPFGGGPGMVLKPEPLFAAVDRILETRRLEAEATGAPEPRRSLGGGGAKAGGLGFPRSRGFSHARCFPAVRQP